MGDVNLRDPFRQRGNGNTSVVAIFGIVALVLLLLVLYWGFLGPNHMFGPANNSGGGINIVVSQKP